ncbi:MAG: BolA family transcriptional regulator [Candidatus Binatia bacterium]|nr:BolA family transcriptional regulator [Candidatus Binatia bacterium]
MPERLRKALITELKPTHLWIEDESAQHAGHPGDRGGSSHYFVRIVSPEFEGKSLVERHRMVYGAIGGRIGRDLHALRLQAATPEEWHSAATVSEPCTCLICNNGGARPPSSEP